jgi:pimeloyl-ACP methyl ester carboxylesterase
MRAGRGRLVFLPGFACRSWIWERVTPVLEKRWDCVIVDWPLELTPGFADLEDFAAWLRTERGPTLVSTDAVVGHSMGGLLALMLLGRGLAAQAVLVDTQLAPPAPFFRNLLASGTDDVTRRMVGETARELSPYFAAGLRDRLKAGDFLGLAEKSAPTGAIYGMRESRDQEEVSRQLGWPDWLRAKVLVRFVPASAHFPMLENPAAFVSVLEEVLA